jgi:hypothetical protein
MATKTRRARSVQIGTAMLEQLAELDTRGLSPETARTYLKLGFRRSHRTRVDTLSAKAQRGALTPAEGQELDEFIRVGNLLAILQSKARQALKNAAMRT